MDGKWFYWIVVAAMCFGTAYADSGQEILDATGVQGGLVVHVGCGDGQLTRQLCPNDRYIVQGLEVDAAKVDAARKSLQTAGGYGAVSISRFDGKRLPYVENVANLVVVDGECQVSQTELMRVLTPRGVAYVKSGSQWKKTVKPWPEAIDEWTHYMHDPAGTCVGKDELVGPPRRMKWSGGPTHARSHEHTASMQAMVSAAGRVFHVMDEGPKASIQLPSKYTLTARDAFNGKVLWKRPIPDWFNHLFPLKAGPAYMPRRLVAVDEVVYVSGGIGHPLLALDAATGDVLHTYDGTKTTLDLIVSDGTIFTMIDPDEKMNDYKQESAHCWTESGRANKRWGWSGKRQQLKAIDASTGKILWEKETPSTPISIAVDARKLCLFNGQTVDALDRTNGKKLWSSEGVEGRVPVIVTGYAPKLILHEDYVIFSPFRRIVALDGTNGKTLWDIKGKPRSGHHSPEDLFVIDGTVWAAGTASGRNATFLGYDLATGEQTKAYPEKNNSFCMHQRCYPGRATEKYLISSVMGTEFIDVKTGEWEIHQWVRGGCIYGMMPANGMLYSTPEACACYYQSELNGFNGLAASERTFPDDLGVRLEKGPAYNKRSPQKANSKEDWPTFRHDNQRSGHVTTNVASQPKQAWEAQFSGRLTPLTLAGGKLFVAIPDEHAVLAIDEDSGKTLWCFTAGGRVDSPPTIHQGTAYFGCADGYIYAVAVDRGELVWRFRAAPIDERILSYGRIESVWPLSGSVLIQNDPSTGKPVLYSVAGRNMFLDGGLRLLMLNPESGQLIAENVMGDKIPGTDKNLQALVKGKHMPVAQPDILSSDGKYVYMKSQTFDLSGKRIRIAPQAQDVQDGEERHLFMPISFLDDSWFHRTYMLYGRAAGEGWAEWQIPPKKAPYGRIMCLDEKNAYAFGRDPELLSNSSVLEYRLYSANKNSSAAGKKKTVGPSVNWHQLAKKPKDELTSLEYNWQVEHPPLLARAMVLAGETLFVAGPPDVVDEKQMWGRSNEPIFRKKMRQQALALEGKQGGILWAVSATDGKRLSETTLDFLPRFDGMIAGGGKLFITTSKGRIVCFE